MDETYNITRQLFLALNLYVIIWHMRVQLLKELGL